MSTVIQFEAHAPAGRAIQHLLDTVLSEHVERTLHVGWDGGDSRRLIIHPSMPRGDSIEIDGSILMLIESLAGTGAVNLNHLYALADEDQREHIALAVFMAAGYEVSSDVGKRRAS